jgi:hypothetical protein
MEPPEKRNANSNDHPAPCQGHFPNNFISTRKTGGLMIFHLVIIVLEALPILIPHEVDTHQESGNGGLPLAANWLIITRSSDTARLR